MLRFSHCLSAISLASFGLISGAIAAPSQAQTQRYDGAGNVALEGIIGQVSVVEGKVLSVRIIGAENGGPISLTQTGDTVRIEGDRDEVRALYRRGAPWQRGLSFAGNKSDRQKFEKFLDSYPQIEITVPARGGLAIDSSALTLDADMPFGIVQTHNLYEVYGVIGASTAAEIIISGQGDLAIGDVTKQLDVLISGSGDIDAKNAGLARIRISGSGDVRLNDIGDVLSVRVSGSGDLRSGDIMGDTDVKISGSGDIIMGQIDGGLDITVSGSGDISADSIDGPMALKIRGSGDIRIKSGEASALNIDISGSGDVRFRGLAVNPVVKVRGSGDVRIDEYRGQVNVSGDGDVRIGDLVFDE